MKIELHQAVMSLLIIVLLALLCLLVEGHYEIRKEDIELTYHISCVGQCESDAYRIQYYSHVSVSFCVIECGLRSHCKGLNYHPRMKACELFTELGNKSGKKGCIFVRREDIIIHKSPCEPICDEGKACDMIEKTCVVKECLVLPNVTNGRVFGNKKEVYSKYVTKCSTGYGTKFENMSSLCTGNGTWQPTHQCLKDCGRLSVPPGVMVDVDTGTLEGDEQIYSCPSGFADVETSLRRVCQVDGNWNGTLPRCVTEVCSDKTCYAEYLNENLPAYDLTSRMVTSFDDCSIYCEQVAPDYKSIIYCTTIAPYNSNCFCKSVATSGGTFTRYNMNGCHYYHKNIT